MRVSDCPVCGVPSYFDTKRRVFVCDECNLLYRRIADKSEVPACENCTHKGRSMVNGRCADCLKTRLTTGTRFVGYEPIKVLV